MTGFNVHLFVIDMKCIITLDLVYRRNYMFIGLNVYVLVFISCDCYVIKIIQLVFSHLKVVILMVVHL
jgi:hypothetical protein